MASVVHLIYVWQGRITESFQVITSHHCSCTSHLCGLSAHLHWEEPDLCFTGRSCLLSSVPGFPAVIWHFEPVLELILNGILTQMKIEKACWSSVRWEREYKCFPAKVNIILNSCEFVKTHLFKWQSSHNQEISFSMLMVNQPPQPQVRKSRLMLKGLSITF